MLAQSALKRLGLVFAVSLALALLVAGMALAEPRIKTNGCKVYDTNQVDPIAHQEHQHRQFGNTSTTNRSTGESLFNNKDVSCKTKWFTSAAWFLAERGESVSGISTYYRAPGNQREVKPIPKGLQILATEEKYNCSVGNFAGTFEERPPYGCRGNWTTRVIFPDCWNKKSLQETTTVYSRNGVCPRTHPYKIPQVSFLIRHDNADRKVRKPLVVSAGKNAWEPYTQMHADYFAALQPVFNNQLLDRCLRNAPDKVTVAHPSCGTGG